VRRGDFALALFRQPRAVFGAGRQALQIESRSGGNVVLFIGFMKEMTFEETQPIAAPTNTISEALSGLVRDPGQFIRHWNYKGAILSGAMRAPIFLVTYLVGRESVKLALGAALAQFVFRFFFAGVGGALIQ
jgi:hypothetical protein